VRRAEHFAPLQEGRLRCLLCPRGCLIPPGGKGACRVRVNREGVLRSANYALCSACSMDPIEKKPLYHYYPGRLLLSLGTFGCNLTCRFCQNWQISQGEPTCTRIQPREAVALAKRGADSGCIGIAYTYSEPVVWYEYVRDTSRLADEAGLRNVLVTNGYISERPWRELLPLIDAVNVDLKGMNSEFYREVCSGSPVPVKRNIELAEREGLHVEVTVLVVPGGNDDPRSMQDLFSWLASVDRDIPLHLSRYFPHYRMYAPPTPLDTLRRLKGMAMQELNYVYLGNVWGDEEPDTSCPHCGSPLISRRGYQVQVLGLDQDGNCAECGHRTGIKV